MAVYSVNANRQLYVAKSVVTKLDEKSAVGDLQIVVSGNSESITAPTGAVNKGNQEPLSPFIFFKYKGVDTPIKSDYIPLKSIAYAKATSAADMADKLKQVKVTLDPAINGGAPVRGQDYILNIVLRNFYGMADDDQYFKFGAVHATAGMDAKAFYRKMADSLTKNFSSEISKTLVFEGKDDGLYIKEVEQPWYLGTYAQEQVAFEVLPTTIYVDGDEQIWGIAEKGFSGDTVKNGKKIADLEWFCMGERGDQYRNVGWPNVIPTRYLVDPDKEYNVLDIHYNFVDTGTESYKSEKEITIVAEDAAVINAIIAKINTAAGINIKALATQAGGGESGDSTDTGTDKKETSEKKA